MLIPWFDGLELLSTDLNFLRIVSFEVFLSNFLHYVWYVISCKMGSWIKYSKSLKSTYLDILDLKILCLLTSICLGSIAIVPILFWDVKTSFDDLFCREFLFRITINSLFVIYFSHSHRQGLRKILIWEDKTFIESKFIIKLNYSLVK